MKLPVHIHYSLMNDAEIGHYFRKLSGNVRVGTVFFTLSHYIYSNFEISCVIGLCPVVSKIFLRIFFYLLKLNHHNVSLSLVIDRKTVAMSGDVQVFKYRSNIAQ